MADVQFLLTGNVNQAMVARLIAEVTQRVGQGARSLLIAISSPGGNIYWGVTAYNFLRGLGLDLVSHNVGQVDSIAGVVYCAADQRLAVANARFLIHGVAVTFLGTNPERGEKDLRDQLSQLQQERNSIAAILADRTGRPLADVTNDMLQGRILDVPQAQDYGFVHEAQDAVFEPAQEIVNITG